MGFNTTIMFHNDAYDEFQKHPDQTVKNITMAMNGVRENRHHYGVGNHGNPMVIKRPRHADEETIYVHAGNTLCEMGVYSQETERLMIEHPEFFESMLKLMAYTVKELKNKYKEIQNGTR